jgi:hypothetical protein
VCSSRAQIGAKDYLVASFHQRRAMSLRLHDSDNHQSPCVRACGAAMLRSCLVCGGPECVQHHQEDVVSDR